MSEKPSFFSELKRRNIYKVAVAYAVVGWSLHTVDLDPDFNVAYWVREQINKSKGKLEQAIADYRKPTRGDAYDQCEAMIGCLYARSGKRAETENILNELVNESQGRFVASYPLAQIRATLGNKEDAIRLLEKAYDERSTQVSSGGMGSL